MFRYSPALAGFTLLASLSASAAFAQGQVATARGQVPLAGGTGISAGSPTGSGASNGVAYAGLGLAYLNPDPSVSKDYDGSMVLGAGFFDPRQAFGALDLSMAIISLTDEFADSGSFNAVWHRVLPEDWGSIAIGVENFGTWGTAKDLNTETTTYVAVTKTFLPTQVGVDQFSRITLTVGGGDGRLRTVDSLGRTEGAEIAPFAALAFKPSARTALVLDANSSLLSAAFSFVPFRSLPITASLGATDVLNRVETGAGPVVTFGIGIGFPLF
ncbi:hypothetical protein [Zhongshania sp.]|jgi:hypothetical protein|uniref:hypothetical protein n=1 Tax=Zhongshania sp. TaxID=1971902 RepID=UPI0039E2ED77